MNLYGVLHRVGFRELMRRIYRVEVVGAERIPAEGGVILASNHASIWDPFILGVVTKRPIHYMAKSELFRFRLLARLLHSLNAFPVERGGGDRMAMSEAASLLGQGEVLGIFPQGTSKLHLQRGWHRGAARLALVTGAPLVPVHMTGTHGKPFRTHVRIAVALPIVVEPAKPSVAAARELTARLEHTVLAT